MPYLAAAELPETKGLLFQLRTADVPKRSAFAPNGLIWGTITG